jgi:hypothetical protein
MRQDIAGFIYRNRRNCRRWKIDIITRVFVFAHADERGLLNQIGQVAGRRRRRSAGNGPVVGDAKPALEPRRTFPQHAEKSLLLAAVQLAAKAVEQTGRADDEIDKPDGAPLGFNRRRGEPGKPASDFIALIRRLEGVVLSFAL